MWIGKVNSLATSPAPCPPAPGRQIKFMFQPTPLAAKETSSYEDQERESSFGRTQMCTESFQENSETLEWVDLSH
jgi:hypothetical protein